MVGMAAVRIEGSAGVSERAARKASDRRGYEESLEECSIEVSLHVRPLLTQHR